MEDLIRVTISDRSGSEINVLRPLLDAWTEAVMRYCRLHGFESNPWWNNERASVSILAGAAWTLNGWAALEDFAARKVGRESQGEEKDGRCALYVCSGQGHYAFEAKQAWQNIGNGSDRDAIRPELRRAWNGASVLDVGDEASRIAATFVVPRIVQPHVQRSPGEVRELVENWLSSDPFDDGDLHVPSPDALAYVFPGRSQNFSIQKGQRLFPGIALALFVRKRGTRR